MNDLGRLSPRIPTEIAPSVVGEAESYLRRKRWRWGLGLGVLTASLPVLAFTGVVVLPVTWWLGSGFLTGAALLHPPGSRTPWAKRVLRRWEDLALDQALPRPAAERDARLRAAEALADRICAHPAMDEEARAAVERLLERVRQAVHDLGAAALLQESGTSRSDGERACAAAELRLAGHLSRLEELHRAIVTQEEAGSQRSQYALQAVLERLNAEREVEDLLAHGE